MAEDILAKVREEILTEDRSALPWVPRRLDQTWETQAGIAGAIAGLFAGAAFGAHMGIAGPWGAIAGTVPCAIIGATLGYFSGAKAGASFKRQSPPPTVLTNQRLDSGGYSPRSLGSEEPVCPFCGASKASWWDSSANRCSRCKS